MSGQLIAELCAGESNVRIALFKLFQLWSISDDNLRAGQIKLQKSFNILLDGHAPHIDEDWTGQVLIDIRIASGFCALVRMELNRIHAARPHTQPGKTLGFKKLSHAGGGDHRPAAGIMEIAHKLVSHRHWQEWDSRLDIFGEFGVVACCERHAPA